MAIKHREYIDDLLADLRERQRRDPETLFQQLCELQTGPVITQEVLSTGPDYQYEIPTDFVEVSSLSRKD